MSADERVAGHVPELFRLCWNMANTDEKQVWNVQFYRITTLSLDRTSVVRQTSE